MHFVVAILLVLAHSQEFFPIAAPGSLVLFTLVCAGRRPNISVFRKTDFLLALMLTAYSVVVAMVQCGDLIRESPVGYFAGDGRATYILVFYLGMRISLAARPDSYFDLLRSALLVASGISLFSAATFFYPPISVGESMLGSMVAGAGRVAVGLLGTKNSFAGNNAAALVVAISLWFVEPRHRVIAKPLLLVSLACLTLGLLLSGSRGYFLGVLAASAAVMIWYRSPGKPSMRQVFGGLLVGGICVVVLASTFVAVNTERMEKLSQGDDENVVRRFELFSYTLGKWSESALIGIGPGAITQPDLALREDLSPWFSQRVSGHKAEDGWTWEGDLPLGQHAHNLLLQFGADYGIIGLALLVALILAGLRGTVFRSHAFPSEEDVWRRRLATTSFFYIAVAGASAGYTLTSASIAWATWALLAGCREVPNDDDDDDEWMDDEEEDWDEQEDEFE